MTYTEINQKIDKRSAWIDQLNNIADQMDSDGGTLMSEHIDSIVCEIECEQVLIMEENGTALLQVVT